MQQRNTPSTMTLAVASQAALGLLPCVAGQTLLGMLFVVIHSRAGART